MHKYFKTLFTTVTLPALLLSTGCNSESENNPPPSDKSDSNLTSSSEVERYPTSAFNLISISPSVIDKTTTFTWQAAENATEYSVCRKDISKPKYCDVLATSTTNNAIVNGLDVIKSLTSEYFVIAKGVSGEKSSNEMSLTPQELTPLIQYLKASNTDKDASFGDSIVLSSDGNTLAVGSPREGGTSGAVYLFRYSGSTWTQQAYIKGSNTEAGDGFGRGVALSSDGNTLAVGAPNEGSNGTGVEDTSGTSVISGIQNNNSALNAGAVYLFRYSGSTWTQQAYIKASNTDMGDYFGESVALSSDGNTLAVTSRNEDSIGTGVNSGSEADNSATLSGAVYLFRYGGSIWTQEAYIKASNAETGDYFGWSVALSSDGNTLAVGAMYEDSSGTGVEDTSGTSGISGIQNNNSASSAGAVYLFRYSGSTWTQQAYIKASNTNTDDFFGWSVALSSDGNTLAVGAHSEDSSGTGINSGDQTDNTADYSGAVYLFRYNGAIWTQEAYIKASNTGMSDHFGESLALSSDGNTLAVGAPGEDSDGTGVNSEAEADNSAYGSGVVYLFRYSAATWAQQAYIKASNTNNNDNFGEAVALSLDGNTLAVGAPGEDSNGTGVNSGAEADNSAVKSGAVYIY